MSKSNDIELVPTEKIFDASRAGWEKVMDSDGNQEYAIQNGEYFYLFDRGIKVESDAQKA